MRRSVRNILYLGLIVLTAAIAFFLMTQVAYSGQSVEIDGTAVSLDGRSEAII